MAIASNVSLVTLKGQYVDYTGNAIAGQIKFTLSNATRNQIADQIIIPSTVSATFDNTGSFATQLPATNDPDLVDAFTYTVEESFSGGRTYSISLPVAAPADRTNLIINPSFELDAGNWFGSNCSLSRVTTDAMIGVASLRTTTSTAGNIYTGANQLTITPSTIYTWSVYIKSSVARTVRAQIDWATTGGTYISSSAGTSAVSTTTSWTRYSITATSPSNAGKATPLLLIDGTLLSETHLIDGALFENSSTLNFYFDGSTDGVNGTASWNGAPNASTSFLDCDIRDNLCTNPSFETNVNNWTGYFTSTRIQDSGQGAPFGSNAMSVQITNTGGGNPNGAVHIPSTVLPAGTTVTISAYIKGTAGRVIRLGGRVVSASNVLLSEDNGGVDFVMTGSWQRISTSYTYSEQGFKPGMQIYITSANLVGTDTFYLDGVLIETGSTLGAYFDGSLPYGSWTGTANASTSKITRNLFDITDFSPVGSFPPYYAYAANSAWIVLDASVQTMDSKIAQAQTGFIKANPTYDWLYYRTYAEVAAYGTYADVLSGIYFLAGDLARGNLITNPSFETNTATWGSIGASAAVRSTAQSAFDSASLLLTANATTALGPYNTGATGRIPVTAGQTYTYSIFVRDVNTAVNYRAGIEFYNSLTAGTNLGTTYGTSTAVTSSGWTRLSVTVTAPVGALGAVPICYSVSTPSNGTQAYFDAALFEESSSLGTYIEGESWVVKHQTQATNATASNASATVQLGIITSGYAERLDELLMVGA